MSNVHHILQMPNVAFDHSTFKGKYPLWEAQSKTWHRLDRVYATEEQIVELAEILETSEYFSSTTLEHPSIPEFTVISDDPRPGVNTYVCFRKSVLTVDDIPTEEFDTTTRQMIPVIDAYVYLNNRGTLCNYVLTLCKCVLSNKEHQLPSTGQFVTYVHDDPISHACMNFDPEYMFEFNRTIKMLYMIVQMVSLERPEIICYGRTPAQNGSSGGKKKPGNKKPVRMVKTLRFPACTATMLAEHIKRNPAKINCPCWGVAGHWRTCKSGKKVWIKPYRKGKQRHNPAVYQPKCYTFPEEIKEVTY